MDNGPDNKELMIEDIGLKDGMIDMELTGEPVKVFYAALVELYDGSGAENFLTVTVEHPIGPTSRKFEITIRDCAGNLSPAEKIEQLEKEIQKLKEERDS